jgi:hypothetical protein
MQAFKLSSQRSHMGGRVRVFCQFPKRPENASARLGLLAREVSFGFPCPKDLPGRARASQDPPFAGGRRTRPSPHAGFES